MFQYAFARSLAIHTGRDVYIDAESLNKKIIGEELGSNTIRDYGLSNFNITLKQVDSLRRCLWNYTRKDKWYYEMVEILCEKGKYPYKYYSQKGFDDISGYKPLMSITLGFCLCCMPRASEVGSMPRWQPAICAASCSVTARISRCRRRSGRTARRKEVQERS